MHVMFVASEATPYSKTGGLADVCSALPKALSQLGCKVSIVTPLYKCAREYFTHSNERLESMYGVTLEAVVGRETKRAGVQRTKLSGSEVDVYFIEHDDYFNRDGIYNNQGVDYSDNCERYSFFSRSALELIRVLNLDVDVINANDWQTGLVPVYLDSIYKTRSRFEYDSIFGGAGRPRYDASVRQGANPFDRIKTVITIHNLRHQGRFWRGAMDLTGLDWSLFTYDKMEFYGQLNMLKSGLVFSDAITTVSPKYAQEIQTEECGERLRGVLQTRSQDLRGILNGIDVDEWNPATDKAIAANYTSETFPIGKPKCKAALQREMGLPEDPNVPLFGVVSRFDPQKGLDLVAEVTPELVEREGAQLVVLGSGERSLADHFASLARRYPRNVAVRNYFSPDLSHRIEAGIDVFLMPSRYEPCGLNQMYSLRYGSLPLVHNVGGLYDSVTNASDENIQNGTANGFVFYWCNADDMMKAIRWALHCYRDRRDDWTKMIRRAMTEDLSWKQSATKYLELYTELVDRK
ncbi:MAG: glycogen synthase [Thermoguttaceae bacterium]|nr:glycogen synthase [Thermoguttaceae bacterium]